MVASTFHGNLPVQITRFTLNTVAFETSISLSSRSESETHSIERNAKSCDFPARRHPVKEEVHDQVVYASCACRAETSAGAHARYVHRSCSGSTCCQCCSKPRNR